MRTTLVLVAALLLSGCRTGGVAPADLILTGGKVFTADAAKPWAEAIAVRGEVIAAVGTNDEIAALRGPSTRVIDLHGRVVVPGINDAHAHEPSISTSIRAEIPRGATISDVLEAVRRAAANAPTGATVAAQLYPTLWESPDLTREALDRIAPDRPIVLSNLGGHGALLNSAALRAWGIDENVADPPGGQYGRTANGSLDGRIYEHALWRHHRIFAARDTDDALRQALRDFSAHVASLGIASVQTMPIHDSDRIRALIAGMELPIRWRVMDFHFAGDTVVPRQTPLKIILDGTPLERWAFYRDPYADAATRGKLNYTTQELEAIVDATRRDGRQLLVHAVGDAAVQALIDAMRKSDREGWPARRVRVEHGDGIRADQLEAIREFGIIVVQNPSHLMLADVMAARFGPERMRQMTPLKSLPIVAIGSDGPINPWLNVMFATIHPGRPDEALSREQAVIAYTRGSAYAEFAEGRKGTLAPGMLADLAVLSQDIFNVAAEALPATTSELTVVGGRIVHEK